MNEQWHLEKLLPDERGELKALLHGPVGRLTREQFDARRDKLRGIFKHQQELLVESMLNHQSTPRVGLDILEEQLDEIDHDMVRIAELWNKALGFPIHPPPPREEGDDK
jgi:hypothetical protein